MTTASISLCHKPAVLAGVGFTGILCNYSSIGAFYRWEKKTLSLWEVVFYV